jgi:1-acyl-sn-glycerol-3-phosphate acyltransferase
VGANLLKGKQGVPKSATTSGPPACEDRRVERGGVDETRAEVVSRRLRTVPPILLGALLVTLLLPVLTVAALVVDVARWLTRRVPFMALRMLAVIWVYLVGEALGILVFSLTWLLALGPRRRAMLQASTWRVQQAWAGAIFATARTVLGLKVHVDGDEHVTPGPIIVLIRHASILDNLLPSVFVARPHRVRLRYVLKRELLGDPGLDIGGKRLPNYFVRRGTGAEVERENIRRLATGMGPDEGMLLYPEGTRFTEERRTRAIAKIAERDPQLAERAARIRHLLPPKVGGVLAILDGAPDADVLIMGHTGFDGLRRMSEIWQGVLVGRDIHVSFRRVPRADVPTERDRRVAWLFDEWTTLDGWVGERLAERQPAAGTAGPAPAPV